MANVMYKQCQLSRNKTSQVAWIPSEFAKAGKVVKIKQNDGTWEDGWRVIEIGGSATASTLLLQEQNRREVECVLGG